MKLNKRVAQSNTFGAVTEEWLEVKQKEWKSPYFGDVKSSIEIHFLPDLGQRAIEDITSFEIFSVRKRRLKNRENYRWPAVQDRSVELYLLMPT